MILLSLAALCLLTAGFLPRAKAAAGRLWDAWRHPHAGAWYDAAVQPDTVCAVSGETVFAASEGVLVVQSLDGTVCFRTDTALAAPRLKAADGLAVLYETGGRQLVLATAASAVCVPCPGGIYGVSTGGGRASVITTASGYSTVVQVYDETGALCTTLPFSDRWVTACTVSKEALLCVTLDDSGACGATVQEKTKRSWTLNASECFTAAPCGKDRVALVTSKGLTFYGLDGTLNGVWTGGTPQTWSVSPAGFVAVLLEDDILVTVDSTGAELGRTALETPPRAISAGPESVYVLTDQVADAYDRQLNLTAQTAAGSRAASITSAPHGALLLGDGEGFYWSPAR